METIAIETIGKAKFREKQANQQMMILMKQKILMLEFSSNYILSELINNF